MSEYSRLSGIKVFNFLQESLILLEKEKDSSNAQYMNVLSISHRLAFYLEKVSSYRVDLCPIFSKSKKMINPEILLHNEKKNFLSIICRNSYLTEEEQGKIFLLKKKFPSLLTIGISFLNTKPYNLIYSFNKEKITYYHFNCIDYSMTLLKKHEIYEQIDNQDQLTLGIRKH